jgi:hypothetical protein
MIGDSKQASDTCLIYTANAVHVQGYAFGIYDVDLTHLLLTVPFLRVQCLNKSTYIYHTESEPKDNSSLPIALHCFLRNVLRS